MQTVPLGQPNKSMNTTKPTEPAPDRHEASGWRTIESAPRDGTVIHLGNQFGTWYGKWEPVYVSGFRPKNPWFSMMLGHQYMKKHNTVPTHWMPLPPAPAETTNQ